ncbi:MAG: Holliday junction branch migration protein RuvA [Anaerotignum sp.]|nr:Holliday junction branch migration protein RuvA [Anaerotignum sp.]
MISYMKGNLTYRGGSYIILETGGIGYQIFVSLGMLSQLPELGKEIKVFTYMSVKEDGISLFGFSSKEEQEMFLKLLTVGGVGPKGALGFLSQLTPQEIIMAIISGDEKTLSKAPGVGRKTAQRVILELKDKCSTEDAIAIPFASQGEARGVGGAKFEAIDAMTALGYSRSEAAQTVGQVAVEGMTTEEILKAALKKMITF